MVGETESKQIMQCSVMCAGEEVHQAAQRRDDSRRRGRGLPVSIFPSPYSCGRGTPPAFGIARGREDRSLGLGSTIFCTRSAPSNTMATVVAMETSGGAGKDGTPHREPLTQRHGLSLELLPERSPPAQMGPLSPGRPEGQRSEESHRAGARGPRRG